MSKKSKKTITTAFPPPEPPAVKSAEIAGTVRLSGHMGDSIVTLGVLRNLGGIWDVVMVDSPNVLGAWLPLVPLVQEIFLAQPYVRNVSIQNQPCSLDLTNFRRHLDRTRSLLWGQQAEAESILGRSIPYDASPWLSGIEPHSYSPGRIVVARSFRYRNPTFPWKALVEHFRERLLFVGLKDEHDDFQNHFGWVEWFKTSTLFEVAQLMAGADAVFANQCGPHMVALGMGVPVVSEVCHWVPDCIFKRDNVVYCANGSLKFEDFSSDGTEPDIADIDLNQVPPGRWQFEDQVMSDFDELLYYFCRKNKGIDKQTLKTTILRANVMRLKGHFTPDVVRQIDGGSWRQAFENAGIPLNP